MNLDEKSCTYSQQFSVLIPCKDEQATIAQVISAFRAELPAAEIIVCDNNSQDETASLAEAAGATVVKEWRQGKGHAVRTLFSLANRPYCVLVDGDATYLAKDVHKLALAIISKQADMVVSVRENATSQAYRRGHKTGNQFFSWCLSKLMNYPLIDVFSGYRVMSLNFVKSFPCLSSGFEIETELTVHALDLGLRVMEIPSAYGVRPDGSLSKLKTYRDGFIIMLTLLHLFSQIQPIRFYGLIAASLAIVSLSLGFPLITTYLETGLVPRFPTAILASALMVLAAICLLGGIMLDSISRARREIKRLFFLKNQS